MVRSPTLESLEHGLSEHCQTSGLARAEVGLRILPFGAACVRNSFDGLRQRQTLREEAGARPRELGLEPRKLGSAEQGRFGQDNHSCSTGTFAKEERKPNHSNQQRQLREPLTTIP